MLGVLKHFAELGTIFDPELGSGPPPPPTNSYVAEDGVTAYVAEDGVTPYVTE